MHAITHLIYTGKDHGEETNRGTHGRLPDGAEGASVQGLPEAMPDFMAGALRGAGRHEGRGDCAGPVGCKRCGGELKPGIAIKQTFSGSPDFAGGSIVTMSPGGPGRLIGCMKCSACGWSVS